MENREEIKAFLLSSSKKQGRNEDFDKNGGGEIMS